MEWFPSKILYQHDFIKNVLNGLLIQHPPMIELWLTNRCNLKCYWCGESKARDSYKGDWNIELLKQRMTEFAMLGTKAVTIEGGGEPTLYPDLEELVEHIDYLGVEMGLITNGVVIPSESILKKLKWIRLSLDSATKKAFELTKGVDLFDTVMDNVKTYGEFCHENNITFGISYVITNISRIGLYSLLRKLQGYKGVSYIQLKSVSGFDEEYIPVTDGSLDWTKSLSTETMEVYLVDCFKGNDGVGCTANSITSTIMNNGDVLFCKRLRYNSKYDNDFTIIGNIKTNTVQEVYNGEKRKKIAELVKDKNFCTKECPSCRLSKYNLVLDDLISNKKNTWKFL